MKRVNNLFDKVIAVDNLLLAFHKARKGCSEKNYVIDYSNNLFENIGFLRIALAVGDYRFGEYKFFEIFEPKRRVISVAPFENRIVHHAIINICGDFFERHLVFDTYANRIGKGSLAAVERAKRMMARYEYVAKLDVRKYFDSISHAILKEKIKRLFKDKELLQLFYDIIDSYCCKSGFGLPIGNLTSQYFANYYLSACDHYIKETLGVPGYVRYMDDMLVFSKSRAEIKYFVDSISDFLLREDCLVLKNPQIARTALGVPFLGYKVYGKKILLNSRNKRRFKHLFFKYNRLYEDGKWSDLEYRQHFGALMAYVKNADTFRLRSLYCNYSNGH